MLADDHAVEAVVFGQGAIGQGQHSQITSAQRVPHSMSTISIASPNPPAHPCCPIGAGVGRRDLVLRMKNFSYV
jgi:hypothetical protein